MSDLHPNDIDVLIHRYVDGELNGVECAAFEQRLSAEPELQHAVDEARAYVGLFSAERDAATPCPTDGFQSRVVETVRRLPVGEPGGGGDSAEVQQLVRRILVAAVILFSLGFLVYAGLLRQTDEAELIAAPDEIKSEMERIDAIAIQMKQGGESSVGSAADSGKERTK